MKLIMGVHRVCPDCEGSGRRTAMNDEERRERTRVLRIAKRRDEAPPKIIHPECGSCHGDGFVTIARGT